MAHNYHVLTERTAIILGVVDAAGNSREHDCTAADIATAAESSHATLGEAYDAAHEARTDGRDRWVIDESGDSHFVAGA